MIVHIENNNKTITSLQSEPQVHGGQAINEVPTYASQKHKVSKGVRNTSKLNKLGFTQQPYNTTSGIPYYGGDKGDKESKMPSMISLESTGIRISARLTHKPKQKYGLFSNLS